MAKINGKFNEATRVAVTVKVATIFYFLVDSLWTYHTMTTEGKIKGLEHLLRKCPERKKSF